MSNYDLGQSGGSATTSLATGQLPAHAHSLIGNSTTGSTGTPAAGVRLAAHKTSYGPAVNLVAMAPNMLGDAGGGQAHNNRQPYLGLFFIIALQGIYPSRS